MNPRLLHLIRPAHWPGHLLPRRAAERVSRWPVRLPGGRGSASRAHPSILRFVRKRIRTLTLSVLGVISGVAGDASAHRLDECLQATRISVETNRIDLAIDLTPGVAMANRLWGLVDEDRDGQVSAEEQAAYVRRVWKETRIGLDGMVLSPRETEVSFPSFEEFRSGHGVIRMRASADIRPLVVGSHQLTLTNAHLPSLSVYLVNALMPKNGAITITGQGRDELQKGYRLDFGVKGSAP